MIVVEIVEPNITQEENARNLEKVKEQMKKMVRNQMLKNQMTPKDREEK